MALNNKHVSVLLEPSIEALNVKEDGVYVDCTLGYAGHSSAILKRLKKGRLYAFDQDADARSYSENVLSKISDRYEIIASNFSSLKQELEKRGVFKVDGVLFDLGVSSPQLDDASRGFSFHYDAPLDMRMDKTRKKSAKNVVNEYSLEDLSRIIKCYGQEKYHRQIASKIVEKRLEKPIETTLELAELIKQSVPFKYRRQTNPARRTFQAIRIEVNGELEVLPKALNDAIDLLKEGGVICVITFHSLEDKICKDVFFERSKQDPLLIGLPDSIVKQKPDLKVLKKIKPTKEEIDLNKRSRSATLRVAIKQ